MSFRDVPTPVMASIPRSQRASGEALCARTIVLHSTRIDVRIVRIGEVSVISTGTSIGKRWAGVELRKFEGMHRTGAEDRIRGDFRNTLSGPKRGVLRGHRVLVAICPDVLAEKTSAPRPGSETRSDFADRIVPAIRSLLYRLVLSPAPTVPAGEIRASNGMGTGCADRGHCTRFGVAGKRGRAAFREAMGSGRAPGRGPRAHSGRALSLRKEPHLHGHVWNAAGDRTGCGSMDPAAGCDRVVCGRNLDSHPK